MLEVVTLVVTLASKIYWGIKLIERAKGADISAAIGADWLYMLV